MKRRSFFSLLAGAAGTPLLPKTPLPEAKPERLLLIADETNDLPGLVYDPMKYMGERRWSNSPQPTAQISNEVLDNIYARLCETGTPLT